MPGSHNRAFDTDWEGGDAPLNHTPHAASNAVAREELEFTLNDIVDQAMSDMKRSIDGEERARAADHPDAEKILQMKMKFKYKYKYKYRTMANESAAQQMLDSLDYNHDGVVDPHELARGLCTSDLSTGTYAFAKTAPAEEPEEVVPMPFSVPADEVTIDSVSALKESAQACLNDTWRALAVASSEERLGLMPEARWLKKLVAQLEALLAVLSEAKDAALAESRGKRGYQSGPVDPAEAEKQAVDMANAKVQLALKNMSNGVTEINSSKTNIMQTTKMFNLVTNLRKELGMSGQAAQAMAKSPAGAAVEERPYQLHAPHSPNSLAGDWNKSILVTKKSKKIGSLGKQNKTFKEFRADPWERMLVVQNSRK